MSPVFRRGWPLLASSFVNKCGAIGLSLLPMLLVERHAGTGEASLVMAIVKGAGLFGLLLGGRISDRLGPRASVLLAFLLQGLGLGLLPLAPTLVLVALAALSARVGDSLFQGPARLLLTDVAGTTHRNEAMGWLRTASNAGQVVCFGIGVLGSGFGLAPLMFFDSATSFVALGVGLRFLPRIESAHSTAESGSDVRPSSWRPAILCAFANGGFVFVYELFMVGGAATFRERFGEAGLATFSAAMVVNTVLCALVAVYAARMMRDVEVAFPLGAALLGLGTTLALWPGAPRQLVFAGAFVLTLGEIIYTALSSITLLRLVPEGVPRGDGYARLLMLQDGCRIAGGALAFPLVVRGSAPAVFVASASLMAALVALFAGRLSSRALAPDPAMPALATAPKP